MKWGEEIRFLEKESKVIIVNLKKGIFCKIKKEAKELLDIYIEKKDINTICSIPQEDKNKFLTLVNYLKDKGYITEEKRDNDKVINQETILTTPKIAYYSISESCNFNCKFCYAKPKYKRNPYWGDLKLSEKIIKRMRDINVAYLIVSGGEPFLRRDLFKVLSYAKTYIPKIAITTNGSLIGEKEAEKLKEIEIDYIQISLESTIEKKNDLLRGKGSFKKVINSVKNLREVGFSKDNIYITATITKNNVKELILFEDFASKIGVNYSFSLFQPVRNNKVNKLLMPTCKDLFFLYFKIAKKYGGLRKVDMQSLLGEKINDSLVPSLKTHCGIGVRTIGVKEDGRVVPCHLFFSSDSFVIGNILDDDILQKCEKFLSDIPSIADINECNNCDIKYFCGNGCWAGNYFLKGDFNKKTEYCEFFYKYYSPIIWNIGEENEAAKIYKIFESFHNQYVEEVKNEK